MYRLVPIKKSTKIGNHDFFFKDFETFYNIARVITVSLTGKYSIGVQTKKIEDIKEFIRVQADYETLMVYIYVPETLVDYMAMYETDLNVSEKVKPFEEFRELIRKYSVLFEKKVDSLLYASIEHDYESMEDAISKLAETYGSYNPISEKMLEPLFIINKIVYPRTVLLDYLFLGRYRDYKLKKCLQAVGNDVALYSCIKNINELMQQKVTYFKSGSGSKLIKAVNTKRLTIMYRVLVLERSGLNDITLLLNLYERGLSVNDIVQEEYE